MYSSSAVGCSVSSMEFNRRLNIVNEESQTGVAPGREPCACARAMGYTHAYGVTSWSGVSLPISVR